MIPDPKYWYIHNVQDDSEEINIYDGSDYPVLTVSTREENEEDGMQGYTAKELALHILRALNAKDPIQ